MTQANAVGFAFSSISVFHQLLERFHRNSAREIGERAVTQHSRIDIVVTSGARMPPIRHFANPQNFSGEFFEVTLGFTDPPERLDNLFHYGFVNLYFLYAIDCKLGRFEIPPILQSILLNTSLHNKFL
jgi:hypothetical protein